MVDSDDSEKTLEASDHKLEQARRKGDVPMAPEMRHALMVGGMLLSLLAFGTHAAMGLARLCAALWAAAENPLDSGTAWRAVAYAAGSAGLAVGPLLAVMMIAAILLFFAQGRPSLSWTRIAPKWSRLSPLEGLKRLFGLQALGTFGRTLLKLVALFVVLVLVLRPHLPALSQLVGANPVRTAMVAVALSVALLKASAIFTAVIAGYDFWSQRRSFAKRMRMSRQEYMDEIKQSDGDPKVKARIRAIGAQRARRRMMQAVPTASVVITNPTHFAVALRYEHGQMAAPLVVAKGTDDVALRIRAIATESGVPIVESPPLARALHAAVDVDHPIHPEHYAAVAEVISYVMRLARR
jgi:flagellar biosynthesis protein FlhB